jgi:hypothetical protein
VIPPACATAFPAFVRALQVELGTIGPTCCAVTEPPAAPANAIALQLEPCDPAAAEVAIAVSGPAPSVAMHRTLPLGDVSPPARPRALAMGVAELVRAVVAPAPPPAATATQPAATPPPINDDRPRFRTALAATLELPAYPGRHSHLWGGRIAATGAASRWYGAVELFAAAGNASFPLGTVAMRVVGGGLSAGPRFALRRLTLDVGATGALAWGWAGGETSQPGITTDSGGALIATVGARAALTFPFAPAPGGWALRATVEGGAVVRGIEAHVEGSDPAGLAGPYVIIGLGLSWSQ